MGQSQSAPEHRDVPIEQLSHEMALRFADKCFSHLEIAHYKDVFKSLADHQDAIEYWKEETLCRFLSLPEPIYAGPVLYQMSTYLGSFPFPSLAPCILTREAMLKVITLMTDRFKVVLKRGRQDKNKLLFRSLAVFDRRMSVASSQLPHGTSEKTLSELKMTDLSDQLGEQQQSGEGEEEEEDDDDLTLAALDALDAIEVFKEDEKKERKMSQAHIPKANLQKLLMVMLLFAPLTPQDNIATFSESLDAQQLELLSQTANAMVAAFSFGATDGAIRYQSFIKAITVTMPYLFRPLGPLFDHFLFSKNINFSRSTAPQTTVLKDEPPRKRKSPIRTSLSESEPRILNDITLAQLSASVAIGTTAAHDASSTFHLHTHFDELYSTGSHGTSLSSFSRQVLSWKSSTLLILSGTRSGDDQPVVLGAYLPEPWHENKIHPSESETAAEAVLFQLRPHHAVFRANKYNKSAPHSYFSSRTGIAVGCVIPAQSRIQAQHQKPVLGPVSLLIDDDMSTVTFQHDGAAGSGAFLTDPQLEEAQRMSARSGDITQPTKMVIDIDAIEVWGISSAESGTDEIENQRKRLEWEEAEAERRRGVHFGGDKDGARHLLELAGLVGQSQSGGSV